MCEAKSLLSKTLALLSMFVFLKRSLPLSWCVMKMMGMGWRCSAAAANIVVEEFGLCVGAMTRRIVDIDGELTSARERERVDAEMFQALLVSVLFGSMCVVCFAGQSCRSLGAARRSRSRA